MEKNPKKESKQHHKIFGGDAKETKDDGEHVIVNKFSNKYLKHHKALTNEDEPKSANNMSGIAKAMAEIMDKDSENGGGMKNLDNIDQNAQKYSK